MFLAQPREIRWTVRVVKDRPDPRWVFFRGFIDDGAHTRVHPYGLGVGVSVGATVAGAGVCVMVGVGVCIPCTVNTR